MLLVRHKKRQWWEPPASAGGAGLQSSGREAAFCGSRLLVLLALTEEGSAAEGQAGSACILCGSRLQPRHKPDRLRDSTFRRNSRRVSCRSLSARLLALRSPWRPNVLALTQEGLRLLSRLYRDSRKPGLGSQGDGPAHPGFRQAGNSAGVLKSARMILRDDKCRTRRISASSPRRPPGGPFAERLLDDLLVPRFDAVGVVSHHVLLRVAAYIVTVVFFCSFGYL